jgi:hypothetical protein
MPDEKKIDPFKPQQPSIPGVLPSESKAKPEATPPPEFSGAPQQKAPPPIKLIAMAAIGAFIILVGLILWSRGSSPKPATTSANTAEAPAAAPSEVPKPVEHLPVGPGPIATTSDLAKAWSAKRFLFQNPIMNRTEPAMVVRLPGGGYWGFSLVEPFGNCELEFVTDLDKLRTEYVFHADHPMVGDPCNHTVYDLLRYGGAGASDDLVRGAIVRGNGIRPPMAIEIRADGKQIIAVRYE